VSATWAVIVAAGRGDRLGVDRPKAFAKLGGRPLLAESVERLDRTDWVDSIVIVAPEGWEEPSILLSEEVSASKVVASVPGGATRAESVRAGLDEVPEDALVVLVHDAARPLLPEDVVERVLAPLGEGWDGAAPALRVADTLKRAAEDGGVVETVDRANLWAVQTPQAFLAPVLRGAFGGELEDASDCAKLVVEGGGRVRLVEGDPRLFKVTTQADLAFVESLLARA
jgi:2-C-methyl-D-erythritol 4-phosphate cytidylyltransferase